MKTVDIYTDGACSGNPGKGGLGIVLKYNSFRKEFSEGYRMTTNNRMELLAVVRALSLLKEDCRVNLYSDSKYIVDSVEKRWVYKWKANNWMRNKSDRAQNIDLWDALLPMLDRHKVSFIWVKGHDTNAENNRCDELAREAAAGAVLLTDSVYEEADE